MGEVGLIHDSAELRKLIAENPELPIVVLAGEEANNGEWGWMYCTDVSCSIKKVLDIATPYDDDKGRVFDDEGDFEEAIAYYLEDSEACKNMSDAEFEAAVKREMDMYAGCWRKVIAIYATN